MSIFDDSNIEIGPTRDADTGEIVDEDPTDDVDQRDSNTSSSGSGPEKVAVRKSITVEDQQTKVPTEDGGTVTRADAKQQEAQAEQNRINIENTADFLESKGRDNAADQVRDKARKARRQEKKLEDQINEITEKSQKNRQIRKENTRKRIQDFKNPRIEVDGKTGRASKQGRRFLNRKERLKDKDTFGLSKQEAVQSGSTFLTNPVKGSAQLVSNTFDNDSVQGALFQEGVAGQLAEAGEQFVETGLKRATPQAFDRSIERNVQDIGTFTNSNFGVETRSGAADPRQAFRRSTPALAESQRRAENFVSDIEQRTPDRLQDLTTEGIQTGATLVSETSPGTRNIDFTQGIAGNTSDEIIRRSPGFIAKEVPEKIIETSSLAGAASAGLENPERLSRETVLGAGQVAGDVKEDPIGFGVGEITTDIGLDLVTGGGAAISVPAAQRASSGAQSISQSARKAGSELRQLRQTDSINPVDAATQTTLDNSQLSDIAITDTAPAQNTPRPSTNSQTEIVTPDEFGPLQIRQTQTKSTDTGLSTNLGLTTASTGTSTLSDAFTRAESRGRPQSQALDLVESQTQSQSLDQSLSQAFSTSLSQTIAEPRPQTITEPVPRTQPQPRPRTSSFTESNDDEELNLLEGISGSGESFTFRTHVVP